MRRPDWGWAPGQARGVGKTTALAKVCKELNGTLVCINRREADRVHREFGIRAVAVAEPEHARGHLGPVLFEPEAVGVIWFEGESKITALTTELAETKKGLERAKQALCDAENTSASRLDGLIHVEHDRDHLNDELNRANEHCALLEETLARLLAAPGDADAVLAAKDLLPADKGGYR